MPFGGCGVYYVLHLLCLMLQPAANHIESSAVADEEFHEVGTGQREKIKREVSDDLCEWIQDCAVQKKRREHEGYSAGGHCTKFESLRLSELGQGAARCSLYPAGTGWGSAVG